MVNFTIKTRVVGVDVGVSETTYAIVDIRGNIIAEGKFPTTDYPVLNDYVATLCERILQMVMDNGGYESIRSVGMSVPSANFVTGCIENASNLPWKGIIPLAAMMRDRLGLAVAIANDAHVTALGEKAFGSAHGMRDFVVISLGHGGVGSCIFLNGRPHLGSNGFAGEVGHACVVENGRQCGCGHRGCLETYVSARGIRQTILEKLGTWTGPSLLKKDGDLSPTAVAKACEAGDPLACEVMEYTGSLLGLGLANYAMVLNPETFILTGELAKMGDSLLQPTQNSFEKFVFPNVKGKIKIVVSSLEDDQRDVLGASVLAWEVKEYSLFK